MEKMAGAEIECWLSWLMAAVEDVKMGDSWKRWDGSWGVSGNEIDEIQRLCAWEVRLC